MDSQRTARSTIEADGLSVSIDVAYLAASLRYFDALGSFVAMLRNALGVALPEPLRAVRVESLARGEAPSRGEAATRGEAPIRGEGLVNSLSHILVWRSPTETLLLSKNPPAFAQLEAELASAGDGCMVNQTGGLCVLRVQGRRTDYLLTRLGAMSALPAIGEARTGRFAEVQATAVRFAADEVLLIVERVYVDHLFEWIAVTVADFQP